MRSGAALLTALATMSACGDADDTAVLPVDSSAITAPSAITEPPTSTPLTSTLPASTLARCEDVPRIEAPAERYRSSPVYVGNEMPLEPVGQWARAQPGFQEMWIDRERFGWITLAFTEDVAARDAELQAMFPDAGVVAVQVPSTLEDLLSLQQRAGELLVAAGVAYADSAADVSTWTVSLRVNAADQRLAEALAPVAGERICLEDTGPPVPEGPQPEAGSGWRLLADELVGEPYRTGIATDEAQYEALWALVGLAGEPPPVDFDEEVVVWFGAVYGSTCPIRLDDVVVDLDRSPPLVHAVTVAPGTGVCTADGNPHAFVVAIERTVLPAGPFAIQLGSADPPLGAPEERTLVDADLSAPGAIAAAEQIRPDPMLIAVAGQQEPVQSGATIEPGYSWPYSLYIHCGIAVLGQLNGIWWMTDEGASVMDYVPEPWAVVADRERQTVDVEVLITPGPQPTLTASANAYSVLYHPVSAEVVPGCD